MGNKIRILIGTLVLISLYSFTTNEKVKFYTKDFYKMYAAPDTLTWKQLGDIKFIKKNVKDYGEIDFPVVNFKLKALAKKPVVLSGFIIPIDAKNYAISKNVFANCFFCGKSGPETLAGIKFKGTTPKLKTDQYVTLKGTFRYNETNMDDWIYHIENAEIITKR